MVAYDQQNELMGASCVSAKANDSFMVEAMALLTAIQWIQRVRDTQHKMLITLVTYSKILAHAVQQQNVLDLPSWRAAETVAHIIQEIRDNQFLQVENVARQAVKGAHFLANWARRMRQTVEGFQAEQILLVGTSGSNGFTDSFFRVA